MQATAAPRHEHGRKYTQLATFALSTLIATGCTRSKLNDAAPPASTSSVAAVASAAPPKTTSANDVAIGRDGGVAIPWPAALRKPSLPAPAPVVVAGYPAPLRTCLPDPAHHAGFTSDGNELGYCMTAMGLRCEFLDRLGHHRAVAFGGPDAPKSDAAKITTMEAWLKSEGVPELPQKDCNYLPPPLTGTFRFGDIKLNVLEVAGEYPKSEPVLKVGGAVGTEPPVYPLVLLRPDKKPGEAVRYSNGTQLNVLALSPDGEEIGLVSHTNCMEWCDEFEIVRMSVSHFASLVYNDTGYRALKANKLEAAIDMFTRAAYVDPDRELPAYNLACALARHGDPTAEAALGMAIDRGGPPVRERARKDSDFAKVKDAAWFQRLVQK